MQKKFTKIFSITDKKNKSMDLVFGQVQTTKTNTKMETKNSTPNHINFDRHEIYSTEMMNMNMDLIAESKRNNNGLTNSLYGLFDGYLYNSIKESNDPKIQKLVMMIETNIKNQNLNHLLSLELQRKICS